MKNTIKTLWIRDLLRLKKERSRWLGVVLQPAIFWLILGAGLKESFQLTSGESYTQYFYPGILTMIVLFTSIYASIGVIEDRKMGFLQAVLVASPSRASVALGKIAGVLSIVFVQILLFLFLAPVAGYSVSLISFPQLFLTFFATTVTLGALNLMMAWLLSSAQAYHAIMSLFLLPLWIISGAMFPIPQTEILKYVMIFNPMSYMVEGFRLALSGAQFSQSSGTLLINYLVMIVCLIATFRVMKEDGVKE